MLVAQCSSDLCFLLIYNFEKVQWWYISLLMHCTKLYCRNKVITPFLAHKIHISKFHSISFVCSAVCRLSLSLHFEFYSGKVYARYARYLCTVQCIQHSHAQFAIALCLFCLCMCIWTLANVSVSLRKLRWNHATTKFLIYRFDIACFGTSRWYEFWILNNQGIRLLRLYVLDFDSFFSIISLANSYYSMSLYFMVLIILKAATICLSFHIMFTSTISTSNFIWPCQRILHALDECVRVHVRDEERTYD